MSAPASLVVLDLGNTALKAVTFDAAGVPALLGRRLHLAPEDAPLPPLPAEARLLCVSVLDGHLDALAEEIGRPLEVAGRDFALPIENRTDRPEETGNDRLCAALGATERAGGPAVTIGLGTAVTVDAVDADGVFLGGAIAPGIRAAAAGLGAYAPRLPVGTVDPGAPVEFPGRTTRDALRAGLRFGWAGLVDRLVDEACRAAAGDADPATVRVYLAGGDGPAVRPLLRTALEEAPHLVAEGARLAWLRTR